MKGEKFYQCVGENFGFPCKIGYCGYVHTLEKWIDLLWGIKAAQAKEYFFGSANEEVLEYILKNMGKRLVQQKRR